MQFSEKNWSNSTLALAPLVGCRTLLWEILDPPLRALLVHILLIVHLYFYEVYSWVFIIAADSKYEQYFYQGVLCDGSLKELNRSIFKTYSTNLFFGFLLKEVSMSSCKYVCSKVYPTTCR